MATRYWIGNAKAVKDVWTFTPTASNSQTYTITCNGKTVSYTADGSALVAEITAGLVAAMNSITDPPPAEFLEGTWEDATTLVRFTGTVAGVPHTFTGSATGGGALAESNVTPASGPNFMNAAGNWSGATLPVDSDTVIFADNGVDVLYGLDLNGVTPAIIRIDHDFTGNIGLPRTNADGNYPEYRGQYAKWGNSGDAGHTAVTIGQGAGSGSSLIKLDFGTGRYTAIVMNSGQSDDDDDSAIQLLGSHASNALTVNKGSVGIAENPGETATLATLNVNYISSQESDAIVYCGSGVTLGAVNKSGGLLTVNSSPSGTIKHYAGIAELLNATAGVMEIYGGTVYAGTATSFSDIITISGDGVLDLSRSLDTKSFTDPVSAYRVSPAPVKDPFGTASGLVLTFPDIVHPDLGPNKTLTIT